MKALNILEFINSGDNVRSKYNVSINSQEVYLLYSRYENKILDDWDFYYNFLPPKWKEEVLRYKFNTDRNNSLMGKLMLYIGYYILTGRRILLNDLLKGTFGKPYFKNSRINFNLSHSGNGVICGFSINSLGVDIEKLSSIDIDCFEDVFTYEEFEIIKKEGEEKFFNFWTQKEAISKEIGKGLILPFKNIELGVNRAKINNELWHIKGERMDEFYYSVASRVPIKNVKILNIYF